jgi:hypothetical protein
MERDSIKKRQAEGIYSKSRNRQKLSNDELLKNNTAIVNCLKPHMSLQKTAQSVPTVTKIKRYYKNNNTVCTNLIVGLVLFFFHHLFLF